MNEKMNEKIEQTKLWEGVPEKIEGRKTQQIEAGTYVAEYVGCSLLKGIISKFSQEPENAYKHIAKIQESGAEISFLTPTELTTINRLGKLYTAITGKTYEGGEVSIRGWRGKKFLIRIEIQKTEVGEFPRVREFMPLPKKQENKE